MLSGFCVDRLLLCGALTVAIVGTQDAPTTRQLAVTLEEYVHAGLTPCQAHRVPYGVEQVHQGGDVVPAAPDVKAIGSIAGWRYTGDMVGKSIRRRMVIAALLVAAPELRAQGDDARLSAAIAKLDAALRTPNPTDIAKLVNGIREARTLILPPGPLVRLKEIAPGDLVYQDPDKNQWRLSFIVDKVTRDWVLRTYSSPCPTGAAPFPRENRTTETSGWTVVQCWPPRQ